MSARETTGVRQFDYDRTVALSDGVFAIALTLLVLNISVPGLVGGGRACGTRSRAMSVSCSATR